MTAPLAVEFAGEQFTVESGTTFAIGREGDLAIDDNPYLHRHFLEVYDREGLWWIANRGTRVAAQVTDSRGLMRSSLGPGAVLPLVFPVSTLSFAAGPTAYELGLTTQVGTYAPPAHRATASVGTTVAPTAFTASQLQAIVALAEPVLRHPGAGAWEIPTAVDAAKRLGWTQTRFNRKLDNVCDKLDRCGVTGLRGGPGAQAANRRMRLVEYAVATLLVTGDDLALLALDTPKDD
ncbi:hypothetical protein IEE94_01105 [Yimella sp. cx-573]|nr:hypothetical protein [Yimella sp. cx-573]